MNRTALETVRILRAEKGDISGQLIADRLGVSRAAVSKSVAGLRKIGFNISSSTRVGYRLNAVPDIPSAEVLQSILTTNFMGHWIEYHESIDSTNNRAMELAHKGAPEGSVVTAGSQTEGRARNGGIWDSPSGKNLYISVILTPDIPAERAQELEMLAIESLKKTVLQFAPDLSIRAEPDGLWSQGGKTGGVLCEVYGEVNRIQHLVAGIGLNVSHRGSSPESLSLEYLTGKLFSRAELTAALLTSLEKDYLKWKSDEQS
ncbi:biotin--[acetyl-CoA-carboxylase] ligase [Candidatus Fermentibacteria bacterium]|nr:MAG: biotin--[acetyl-CoA-carboxylase] ligase [Candidatus Fermentibacteria bacterium]